MPLGGWAPLITTKLTFQLANSGTVLADYNGLSSIELMGRHIVDLTMTVKMVVTIRKLYDPVATFFFLGIRNPCVIWSAFC